MQLIHSDDVFHACEKLLGERSFDGFFGSNLKKAIRKGKKAFYTSKKFYISILMRNDPAKEGRSYFIFIPRRSCPTPHVNQIVYKYEKDNKKISLMWVLPDAATVARFSICPPDLKDTTFLGVHHFSLQHVAGDLQRICDAENKVLI